MDQSQTLPEWLIQTFILLSQAMSKAIVLQSPAYLYEVVPVFYKELNRLDYFDKFYLATDKRNPTGLGANVQILALESDLGWEGNLERLLDEVTEDIFVMMCDDHVVVRQENMNLDKYFDIVERSPELGRLQLSPPTRNYARFLLAHRQPIVVPDDSKAWYPFEKNYRWHLNFQPSIWRRDFLQYVIRGGGNKSQLELRASERARHHSRYVSGYIGDYAVKYENFFASCQVHHTDPQFHKKKKVPHYREEFAHYARKHKLLLDPSKRVHVRRSEFSASVPVQFYMDNYGNDVAYRKFIVRKPGLARKIFTFKKTVRARVAPYVTFSGR